MSEGSDTAKSTLLRNKDPKFSSLNQPSYVSLIKFFNPVLPHYVKIITLKEDSKLTLLTTKLMSGHQ